MEDMDKFSPSTYAASKKYTDTHGSGGTAVQSDWNETDDTADDYIKNKPELGTAALKDSTNAVTENSTDLLESGAAYTALTNKVDKVEGKDLSTNDYTAADKAAVANVAAVIPSTASTSNKLSTASDTAGEEIAGSATGTSIAITDSADGYVQGITVKGHSEVVSGEIKSIGDAGWGVVDLGTLTFTRYTPENGNPYFQTTISDMYSETERLNEDLYCPIYQLPSQPISARNLGNLQIMRYETNIYIRNDSYTDATAFKSAMSGVLLYYPLADATGSTPTLGITSKDGTGQGTAATITTGLPLRSVSDTIFDTADNEKVVTRINGGKINDTNIWNWQPAGGSLTRNYFCSQQVDYKCPEQESEAPLILSDTFSPVSYTGTWSPKKVSYIPEHSDFIYIIVEPEITTVNDLLTAYGNSEIYYNKSTPTTTPLTSAEKFALDSLRTYNPNTQIDATDSPSMTADYLLNTDNGQAVARVDEKSRETVLYAAADNVGTAVVANDTISLIDDIRNYRSIKIEWAYSVAMYNSYGAMQNEYSTKLLEDMKTLNEAQTYNLLEVFMPAYDMFGLGFILSAYDTLTIKEITGSPTAAYIRRVVGIT